MVGKMFPNFNGFIEVTTSHTLLNRLKLPKNRIIIKGISNFLTIYTPTCDLRLNLFSFLTVKAIRL